MPRIPEKALQGVVFLYPSKEHALNSTKHGGTGFIVSKLAPRTSEVIGHACYYPYVVTNRHVVWHPTNAPVMRWNCRDGTTRILETEPTDWIEHPEGDDLLTIPVLGYINMTRDDLSAVRVQDFITKERSAEFQVGVGDEVMMIGRFVNHQGRNLIKPAARFGSISMMPEPIWNRAISRDQLSYAVEMRSRTGFSGSPVAVYRTKATNISDAELPNFWGLLGVNWGYVLDEDGENSWLNGVIPAWRILELLDVPSLRERHDRQDEYMAEQAKNQKPGEAEPAGVSAADNDPPSPDANPRHKEDFTALLRAAAKTKKQGD